MIARLAALVLLAAVVLTTGAQAQTRTSLTDIEDEVMCPVCGTLLELSESPQADRERAFIRRLIAQGRTKAQVEDALVDEYGPNVLATPSGHGFDLSAWIIPAAGILLVAGLLGSAAWQRGRRRGRRESREADAEALSPEDSDRLERDMSSYEL